MTPRPSAAPSADGPSQQPVTAAGQAPPWREKLAELQQTLRRMTRELEQADAGLRAADQAVRAAESVLHSLPARD